MHTKKIFSTLIWILFYQISFANIFPTNGAKLNYTQIMFEYEPVKGAYEYKIIVEEIVTEKKVKQCYVGTDSTIAHLMKDLLQLGHNYRWHYEVFNNKKKPLYVSANYVFSINKSAFIDKYKFDVTVYDTPFVNDNFIVADYGAVLNRKGQIVYFLDSIENPVRDLTLNKDGTFTYNSDANVENRTINSAPLWKSKSVPYDGGFITDYHHEVIKLDNGNFLCLARLRKEPTAMKITDKNGNTILDTLGDVIVQLNNKNEVIWLWKEKDYYLPNDSTIISHTNSLAISPDGKKILLGSRETSSLIQIDRATGIPDFSIGHRLKYGKDIKNGMFFYQHAAFYEGNNIILFNNDKSLTSVNKKPSTSLFGSGKEGTKSSVMIVKQSSSNPDTLEKIWDYRFNFSDASHNHSPRTGSVRLNSNGNFLVSLGAWNRNFELTRDGKIIWELMGYFKNKKNDREFYLPMGAFRIQYASSLYPSYFTVEKQLAIKNTVVLKLNNEGTADDTYTITIHSNNKKDKSFTTIIHIPQQQSQLQKIQPSFDVKPGDELMIEIVPSSNSNNSKTISYSL